MTIAIQDRFFYSIRLHPPTILYATPPPTSLYQKISYIYYIHHLYYNHDVGESTPSTHTSSGPNGVRGGVGRRRTLLSCHAYSLPARAAAKPNISIAPPEGAEAS